MKQVTYSAHDLEQAVGGGLLLTLFGAVLATVALSQRLTPFTTLLLVLGTLITLALLLRCVQLLAALRQRPKFFDPLKTLQRKLVFQQFGGVVTSEAVILALANVWLSQANRADFIVPAVGLIVGLHFFPLAVLFQKRVYVVTGGLMALVSSLAIIALLSGRTPGDAYTWSLVVGLSNALVLWVTAGYVMRLEFRSRGSQRVTT